LLPPHRRIGVRFANGGKALKRIDLNVDIGEGFPFDRELLKFATSANIGLGEHAGSRELTTETVAYCREAGLRVGAHPGYPHRASMGRDPIPEGEHKVYFDSIFVQCQWFAAMYAPDYLKPHGGFYNDTAVVLPEGWRTENDAPTPYGQEGIFLSKHPGVQFLMMLLRVYKLPLMGLDRTSHAEVARRAGKGFIKEGFADRLYRDNGTLMPRDRPGAVIKDPDRVAEQVRRLAPKVDSICLHGDGPDCLQFAERVRKTLEDAGYEVGA